MALSQDEQKKTFGIVTHAISRKGIKAVRQIVCGEARSAEAVALSNFINSRMFGEQIIEKLK